MRLMAIQRQLSCAPLSASVEGANQMLYGIFEAFLYLAAPVSTTFTTWPNESMPATHEILEDRNSLYLGMERKEVLQQIKGPFVCMPVGPGTSMYSFPKQGLRLYFCEGRLARVKRVNASNSR